MSNLTMQLWNRFDRFMFLLVVYFDMVQIFRITGVDFGVYWVNFDRILKYGLTNVRPSISNIYSKDCGDLFVLHSTLMAPLLLRLFKNLIWGINESDSI